MASLREIADCIGIKKNFEVVRDFFGYQTGAPGQISLLRQMRLAQGHHVHLNLIRVGVETFTDADEQEIDSAVAFMRDVYATVDFGVANVGRRSISSDKAGGFVNIGSDDEAVEITREFAIDNARIDVFFVRTYAGSSIGSGPFFGPKDKNVKREMTGIVLALEGSTTVTGFVLAQLVCRYLGLGPRQDANNLMSSQIPNGGELTSRQGEDMTLGSVVFFACEEYTVLVLSGGHFRSGARARRRTRVESTAGRRPTPSLRYVTDGDVRRAAGDHDRLRSVALGIGEQRGRAIFAVAASDDPRRVHDLETIVRDEHAPADVRQLAAYLLGRIDTAAARTALLALLDVPHAPAGTVAQSLGRIGERSAFDALARASASWTGYPRVQAQFAMRLIAHRGDLDFPEPGKPEPELVPLIADDLHDFVWRPAGALVTQIALRSLNAEPFGIELDDRAAQLIQCGTSQFIFLLNRALGSPIDVQTLLHRKTIAGILARQSSQNGLYRRIDGHVDDAARSRAGRRHRLLRSKRHAGARRGGAPLAVGLAFECRSVKRRGAYAARIAGVLGAEGFAVTAAQSGRLLRDVARPALSAV